jgi:hypothetical protein
MGFNSVFKGLICELKRKRRNDSRHTAYTIKERVGELKEKKRRVYTEKKMERIF